MMKKKRKTKRRRAKDEGAYVCPTCGERIVIPLDLSGGAAGLICAKAGVTEAAMPSSMAQVRIRRARRALRISSISGH